VQVSMAKVEIIGPKGLFFETLSLLHRLGTLHVENLSKDSLKGEFVHPMKIDPVQQEEKQRLQQLLSRVNGILSEIGPPTPKVSPEMAAETRPMSEEKMSEEISSSMRPLRL